MRKLRSRGKAIHCVSLPGPCTHDLDHGSISAYSNHGCRCDTCCIAWRRYQREIKARRRAQFRRGDVEIEHGTNAAYDTFGCRCQRCRRARAVYRRLTYVRERENRAAPIPRTEVASVREDVENTT